MTDQPTPEEPSALSNATTEELLQEILLRMEPLKEVDEGRAWRSLDKSTQAKLVTLEDLIDSCNDALGNERSSVFGQSTRLSDEILQHRRIVGIEVTTLGEAEPSYIKAPDAMDIEPDDSHRSVIGLTLTPSTAAH